jgi:hypothetical protein
LHPGTIKSQGDWGEQIRHELEAAKCMVFVWSNATAQSEWLQQEINNAIKAWSSDRLVVATLDDAPLPVGLRDLSPISIRDVAGVKHLIERVQAIVSIRKTAAAERAPTKTRVRRLGWIIGAIVFGVLILTGVVYTQIGLKTGATRITPPPEMALDYARLAALALSIFILGIAMGAGAIWLWHSRSERSSKRARALAASLGGPEVFVSYSRRDTQIVEELIQQIEQLGLAVWIDRQSTSSQRYAAPIVHAIRTSRVVALMSSQNAFASDHVTREVYLAGDFKKPFIVFQLDPTEFPDELLYFVSGFPRVPIATIDRQQLRLLIAKLIPGAYR